MQHSRLGRKRNKIAQHFSAGSARHYTPRDVFHKSKAIRKLQQKLPPSQALRGGIPAAQQILQPDPRTRATFLASCPFCPQGGASNPRHPAIPGAPVAHSCPVAAGPVPLCRQNPWQGFQAYPMT